MSERWGGGEGRGDDSYGYQICGVTYLLTYTYNSFYKNNRFLYFFPHLILLNYFRIFVLFS